MKNNKAGICSVCHQEFKITKTDKMVRHGYKYKRHYKTWLTGFFDYTCYRMALIDPPCKGSEVKAEKIIERIIEKIYIKNESK